MFQCGMTCSWSVDQLLSRGQGLSFAPQLTIFLVPFTPLLKATAWIDVQLSVYGGALPQSSTALIARVYMLFI